MKIFFVLFLFLISAGVTCLASYRQCVQQFQEIVITLEAKKVECEAVKANMAREYDQRLKELIEQQRGEINTLQSEHLEEREKLKDEYEQEN